MSARAEDLLNLRFFNSIKMQSKNVKAEDDEKLSYKRLEQRNYRSIQQLAKSLGLPSNFKASIWFTIKSNYIV